MKKTVWKRILSAVFAVVLLGGSMPQGGTQRVLASDSLQAEALTAAASAVETDLQNANRMQNENRQEETGQAARTKAEQSLWAENAKNSQEGTLQSPGTEAVKDQQTESVQGLQTKNAQGLQTESLQDTQLEGQQNPQTEAAQGTQPEGQQNPQTEAAQGTQPEGQQNPQKETAQDMQTEEQQDPQTETAPGTQTETGRNQTTGIVQTETGVQDSLEQTKPTEVPEPDQEGETQPGEPAEETEQETGSREEPQPEGRQLLARLENMVVEASLSGQEVFPEEVSLQVRSVEELAENDPEAAWQLFELWMEEAAAALTREYVSAHPEAAFTQEDREGIYQKYLSSFYTFLPCEVLLVNPDGSLYEPEDLTLRFLVEDETLASSVEEASNAFCVFFFDEEQKACVEPEHTSVKRSGQEAVFELRNASPGLLIPAEYEQNWTWLGEEGEEETAVQALLQTGARAFVQQGTPCVSSGEYTKVSTGDRTYSSSYEALRRTAQSQVQFWSNSSSVIHGTTVEGYQYMLPQSPSDAGKFGFRITNVAYSRPARCNVDMVVTVTAFDTYALNTSGERVEGIYPFIGMDANLLIYFQGGFSGFELKCDLVRTGTNDRVAGNYRFNWIDIDGTQRYGVALQDGSMDAKYCLASSDVSCGTASWFGKNYHMLYAPESLSEASDLNRSVMFEVSNTSGFYIYVGQNGDESSGMYSTAALQRLQESARSGAYAYTSTSAMGWNAGAYGPTALPSPLAKYVSNDRSSWSEANVLNQVTDSYWYMLELYVPSENSAYYYSEFCLRDILPAGVDYAGEYSVFRMESGEDVSGAFAFAQDGKTLTFTASDILGSSSFYGFTYQLSFLCRLNPDELTPSYSGTEAVYTVTNTGTLISRHQGSEKSTEENSNAVSTRAAVPAPAVDAPRKRILDGEKTVTEKTYESRNETIVFSLTQELPAYQKSWRIKGFFFEDVLEDCFELQSVSLYCEQEQLAAWNAAEAGSDTGAWKLETDGQRITIAASSAPDATLYGKQLRALLAVTVRNGFDLSAYYIETGVDASTAEIPNQASDTLLWEGESNAQVTAKTNQVLVRIREETEKGSLIIRKTDETGAALSGAVFRISAGADIVLGDGSVAYAAGTELGTVSSNAQGTAVMEALLPGTYQVQEITPPPGYSLQKEAQTAEVTVKSAASEAPELVFQNEPTVVYLKKCALPETEGEEPQALAGVSFRIWSRDSADAFSPVTRDTDENGLIRLEGLLPGSYCFQETQALPGYLPDETVQEFQIDGQGLCGGQNGAVILCENDFIKTEFLKTDRATQAPVAGAQLCLTDENGDTVETWTSQTTAHRINGLPAGTYTLTELEAPQGYQKAEPVIVTVRETGQVQTFRISDCRLVRISLTKEILAEEILWAHGNPTFTFCVEGSDLDGKTHRYYDTVEFRPEETADTGSVRLTADFSVPAGTYTAREEQVIRYRLERISSVENGSVSGETAVFDLKDNSSGSAVFVNRKTNDSGLSDTAFVRNTVIGQE